MDTRNRRPMDTAFKQQRLKAWQPILTPKWVIATFTIIGVIFVPLGSILLSVSNSVVEVVTRYDDICGEPNGACMVTMEIPRDMEAPIYFYYQLTNFFQNHRRYVKSRSDAQLSGQGDLSISDYNDCSPMANSLVEPAKRLYPCGLIANSFFTDFFNATVLAPDGSVKFLSGTNWKKEGIAWTTDVNDKFKLPRRDYEGVSRLTQRYIKGQPSIIELPLVTDEEFIVWMRTAGLPTFKKLNRIISETNLKAGSKVQVRIENRFPVSGFNGQKAVVLSTTSFLGGKNPFLGYAYISVGIICLGLATAFLVKHWVSPRSLGDMTYFSWNQERGRSGKKELKVTNISNAGFSAGNTTTHGNE